MIRGDEMEVSNKDNMKIANGKRAQRTTSMIVMKKGRRLRLIHSQKHEERAMNVESLLLVEFVLAFPLNVF
jgi:hypothetical protein